MRWDIQTTAINTFKITHQTDALRSAINTWLSLETFIISLIIFKWWFAIYVHVHVFDGVCFHFFLPKIKMNKRSSLAVSRKASERSQWFKPFGFYVITIENPINQYSFTSAKHHSPASKTNTAREKWNIWERFVPKLEQTTQHVCFILYLTIQIISVFSAVANSWRKSVK